MLKENCKKIFQIKNFLTNEDSAVDFKTIGIKNEIEFLCFTLQNAIHHKISLRQTALISNYYKNPENTEESIDFLEDLASKIIREESDKIFNWKYMAFQENIPTIEKKKYCCKSAMPLISQHDEELNKLIETKNINIAIDILQKIDLKRKFIMDYIYENRGNMVMTKIELIMLGIYDGKLFRKEWEKRFCIKENIISAMLRDKIIDLVDWEDLIIKKKKQRAQIKKN